MRALGAAVVSAAFAVSVGAVSVDPYDAVLLTYWLSSAEESQFSTSDNAVSPFWSAWSSGPDYIEELPPNNCYPDRCSFTGDSDAQVKTYAAGGANGLYLCFTVTDNTWVTRASGDDWGADAVSIFLDDLDAATIGTCTDCLIGLYDSRLSYTTQEFEVFIGGTAFDYFRYSYYDPNMWSWTSVGLSPAQSASQYGIRMERVIVDATHRVLEFFIPWSRMNLVGVPVEGRKLGFAPGYNDKDGDNTNPDCLRWLGKDPWSGDGQYWGDLQVAPGFAASLTVTAPATGARWGQGSTHAITWSSTVVIPGYKIDLSLDGGTTWSTIAPYLSSVLSYNWAVPDTLSTQAKIRVSDATDGSPFGESGLFTICAPYLTVTAPAGGEQWVVGTTAAVRWTSEGQIGPVAVDLSTDNAATWTNLVASTANTGTCACTVPNRVSARCRIRVREAADNVPSDTNTAVFSIVTPYVTVTFPNGGEDFAADSSVTVRWQSAGVTGTVNVDISLDGGTSWNPLVAGIANDGSEVCRMPATASTTCRVRVSDATTGIPSDMSNANFRLTAPSVTVTAPNGGEQWLAGSTQTVTWQSRGAIANVKIELSTNSGSTWTTLLASTANDGSQGITVPSTPSATCRVRVSDAADGQPSDMSNAAFAIVAIAVRVTSPNGGEVWRPGTFHNITWTTVGSVPQVTLQYSTNGGTSWKAIVASFPNGGSYNWTVPNDISRTCLVRVSDAADSVPSDVSDSLFAIDNMTAVLAGRTPVVTGITAFGPNPVRGTLAVEFGLARPMAVAGYVHSMDGRLVRDLGQSQRPAGCYSLVWDCASEAGRRVQAGTYVVTLRLGNDVQRKLVTVAR